LLANRINLHRFCEGFGIRILPKGGERTPRPANVIYGGKNLRRLILDYGEEHAAKVVRCIQISNAFSFEAETLKAVSLYIRKIRPESPAHALFADFLTIDIGRLRERALKLSDKGATIGKVEALFTLLANEFL